MTRDASLPVRGVENFKKWKTMVGLPASFPKLGAISPSELVERTYVRKEKLRRILTGLKRESLLTILFNKGHGCTTFCRFLSSYLQENCTNMRMIPIEIKLDSYWNDDTFSLDLDAQIFRTLFIKFVQASWEDVLFEPAYEDIIGAYDRSWNVQTHRSKILNVLQGQIDSAAEKELAELCPFFFKDLDEIVTTLDSAFNLQVVLLFDIPFTIDEDHAFVFYGIVKDFLANQRVLGSIKEVYCTTAQWHNAFNSIWARPADVVVYEPHRPEEVHSLLWNHHKPLHDSTQMGNGLSAVGFSSNFVRQVWDRTKSIHRIIDETAETFIKTIDCEWKELFSVLSQQEVLLTGEKMR